MIIRIQLPSEEMLQANLDDQSTVHDLIQHLLDDNRLNSSLEYVLTLVLSSHTKLERITRLGENTFAITPKSKQETKSITRATMEKTDRRKVFVVHGRNHNARDAMFTFLRAIGLQPIEWNDAVRLTRKASPYIGEILDVGLNAAQAVVVILTGDDEVRLKRKYSTDDSSNESDLSPQARPNVIFEAGMALAKYPDRTILVELGKSKIFSDISGRHTVRLNNNPNTRNDLAQRLINAGCKVSLVGNDWFSAGDFDV